MKWKIKQFKSAALKNFRANFIVTVFITFVVAFLTSEGTNSVALLKQYDSKTQQASNVVNYAKRITDEEFFRVLMKDLFNGGKEPISDTTSNLIRDLKALSASTAIESVSAFAPEVSVVINAYSAGREIVQKGNIVKALGIIASTVISLLFAIFVGNILIIGKRRFYLDSAKEICHNTGFEKTKHSAFTLFFVFRKGEYGNCMRIMLKKDLLQLLWSLTIVGGFVKLYEYRMISYILADNPNISSKEAFDLSKKLTYGYKWKMFVLDLEFLPWQIVQVLTLGLGGLFFVNPYYYGTLIQCYNCLAANYNMASDEAAMTVEAEADEQKGLIDSAGQIITDLGASITERTRVILAKYNPFRKYDFVTIVMLFLTFAVIGWLWEVVLHIIQTGDFVKRGVLNGPWLPIYGVGGVMALVFMKKYIYNPIKTFGIMIVMFGTLEYLTSYVLELIHGIRWWDYTGYFMNLNGRICLEGVLIFAFAGGAVVYFIAPMLGSVYDKINKKIKVAICVVLMTLFVADVIVSSFKPNVGKGITAGWQEAVEETREVDNES